MLIGVQVGRLQYRGGDQDPGVPGESTTTEGDMQYKYYYYRRYVSHHQRFDKLSQNWSAAEPPARRLSFTIGASTQAQRTPR